MVYLILLISETMNEPSVDTDINTFQENIVCLLLSISDHHCKREPVFTLFQSVNYF